MPEDGIVLSPRKEILTFEEIERLARLFIELGVTKIRLTGGEPLLRKDVEQLVESIGHLPGLVSLGITTSGLLLPAKIARLKAAGVNLINISLDTLDRDKFLVITRRDGFDQAMKAVEAAVAYGFDPVKINCVVMRGINDDELIAFAEWTEKMPIEVRFIEYMPFDGNAWSGAEFLPYLKMIETIKTRYPSLVKIPDDPHNTSKIYQIPGFRGRLGFITSMSDHFCDSCNRIRLTANGQLKVCLFEKSNVSLRDVLRSGASDDELIRMIQDNLSRKNAGHAGMHQVARTKNRPMILIGG